MHAVLAALDPQLVIGGSAVGGLAAGFVLLVNRALKINDRLYAGQVEPVQAENERLRKRVTKLERARETLLREMRRHGLDVPEEVFD